MRRFPKQQTNLIGDILHKGFVLACLGISVCGTGYMGYRAIEYYTTTKPQLAEQQRLAEQELLAEGSSENLKDIAPNIS